MYQGKEVRQYSCLTVIVVTWRQESIASSKFCLPLELLRSEMDDVFSMHESANIFLSISVSFSLVQILLDDFSAHISTDIPLYLIIILY